MFDVSLLHVAMFVPSWLLASYALYKFFDWVTSLGIRND